jgi:hypothetical protein
MLCFRSFATIRYHSEVYCQICDEKVEVTGMGKEYRIKVAKAEDIRKGWREGRKRASD